MIKTSGHVMPMLRCLLYGARMDVKRQEDRETGIEISKYIDSSYAFLMNPFLIRILFQMGFSRNLSIPYSIIKTVEVLI